jgi:hypothetical protein
MRKILVAHTLAVFIAFSVIGVQIAPLKALAVDSCQNAGGNPGFNIDGKTWGSVVTLCANYVAEITETKLSSSNVRKVIPHSKPRLAEPAKPKVAPKPIDAKMRAKLLHRRLAMRGKNSFQPTALTILSSASIAKPGQQVKISVFHNQQFRMAYIATKFVALRFTPSKIDFHFDPKTRGILSPSEPFGSSVRFISEGMHIVRALVTYRAEFRVNGDKRWQTVAGAPTMAALPAKVLVVSAANPPASAHKPAYLVADDCLFHLQNLGCLN